MFLRFTYLNFPLEKLEESKNVYMTEIAPVISKQKGNNQVLLLEPANGSDEFISFSLWQSEADIKEFEASAAYGPVIERIKELVSKPPVQKYFIVNS